MGDFIHVFLNYYREFIQAEFQKVKQGLEGMFSVESRKEPLVAGDTVGCSIYLYPNFDAPVYGITISVVADGKSGKMEILYMPFNRDGDLLSVPQAHFSGTFYEFRKLKLEREVEAILRKVLPDRSRE